MHDYKSNISYLIDYKTGLDYARIATGSSYNYNVAQTAVFEYDAVTSSENAICKIDDTHFLIIYAGASSYGQIRTYSVDANYENITLIDSLQPEASSGNENSIAYISSTLFVNAYQGASSDGYIRTISMDANKDNIAVASSIEHDTTLGSDISVVVINSTHCILAYCGATSDGIIKTFSFDANGANIVQIASLVYDNNALSVANKSCSFLKIDATHFILASNDVDVDGWIRTFSIDGSYENITQIDALEIDTADFVSASLVQIDATHFAVAYQGTDGDGFIKTFSIDANANNITEIAVLEFDTTDANYISMVLIDSTHLMVAYTGVDGDGFIKTFSFNGAFGSITEVYSLEHETADALDNKLIKLTDTRYALAYKGVDGDGFVKTFTMT